MGPGILWSGPTADAGCAWTLVRTERSPTSFVHRPPLPWWPLPQWSPTVGHPCPAGSVSFGSGYSLGAPPLLGVGPSLGLLGSAAPRWRTPFVRSLAPSPGAALLLRSLRSRDAPLIVRGAGARSRDAQTVCATAVVVGFVTRFAFGSVVGLPASARVRPSWLGGAQHAFALGASHLISAPGASRCGSWAGSALPWSHSLFHQLSPSPCRSRGVLVPTDATVAHQEVDESFHSLGRFSFNYLIGVRLKFGLFFCARVTRLRSTWPLMELGLALAPPGGATARVSAAVPRLPGTGARQWAAPVGVAMRPPARIRPARHLSDAVRLRASACRRGPGITWILTMLRTGLGPCSYLRMRFVRALGRRAVSSPSQAAVHPSCFRSVILRCSCACSFKLGSGL